MPNYNYKVKLHGIRAFAFDVDGVLSSPAESRRA